MSTDQVRAEIGASAAEIRQAAHWVLQAVEPACLVDLSGPLTPFYMACCEAVLDLGLATRCLSIDMQAPGTLVAPEILNDHLQRYSAFSQVVQADVDQVLADVSDGVIDLLVLPEGEDTDATQLLMKTWSSKLTSNCMVIAVGADASISGVPIFDGSMPIERATASDLWRTPPAGAPPVMLKQTSTASKSELVDRAPQDASVPVVIQASELERLRKALENAEEQLRAADAQRANSEQRVESLVRSLNNAVFSARLTLRNLQHFQQEVAVMKGSRSWAITAPLRRFFTIIRRLRGMVAQVLTLAKAFLRRARADGWRVAFRESTAFVDDLGGLWALVRGRRIGAEVGLKPVYKLPPQGPAQERLVQRVLLVAELSLPQCLKYRVLQKRQMIERLGVECTVVAWSDVVSVRSLLATHTIVIFYRVPGYAPQLESIRMAKHMGLATFWEADDLIFDLEAYEANSNLRDLDKRLREAILKGVPLYRKAMLECEAVIASTEPLAEAMRSAGARNVHVVVNALDDETSRIAEKIRSTPPKGDGLVRIVYGSGSQAHDSDFRVAAAAIRRVLMARHHVRLTVIGSLNLPTDFDQVDSQIERLPPSDYETYLQRLAKCCINIAPLEDTVFNDAKSNIKYMEAALLGIPSVCSATKEYKATIDDGRTGFLATTEGEWEHLLLKLVDDAKLRREVAANALAEVEARYAPEVIGRNQVAPLLGPQKVKQGGLRVLGVNIFFEPRSFGGATIVAEQVARRINAAGHASYGMVTSLPVSDVHAYKIVRYDSTSAEVFAMGLPGERDPAMEFDNPYPVSEFKHVLRAWNPDVVHLHSIQGFGVQIAEACISEGIPFVVTLHDAWWICARQFMVTGEGRYCYQTTIDLDVCAKCVPNPVMNPYRQHRLREVLSQAALLMSPSEFFRGIYVANGFNPQKVVVNKNGIVKPRIIVERTPPSQRPLRFGFVGGDGPIKGGELIKRALRGLPHTNYELHIVDNELNLGRRSIFEENWKVPGVTRIVRAYSQDTIDEFFGSIDVLLFPTQWKESFGLSVREALIRDVWVIATDAGGVVEDIVAGENGDVIPLQDDGTGLREAIRRLLDNPSRLDGYRNPYADSITLFDDQAAELVSYLADVKRAHPRRRSWDQARREGEFQDELLRYL